MEKAAAMERLTALKSDFYAKSHRAGEAGRDGLLTAEMVDATFAASAAVEEACEAFRLRYYPKALRIVAASDEVYVMSPTGRVTRKVYP